MAAVDDAAGNAREPAGPAPTGPGKPGNEDPPSQQPRWSEPIFRSGLIVGAGLFLVGVACQILNLLAPTVSILIICSGLGIIFGAFGSTAVINYKGFVVAGVAAIAIALLLLVDYVMRESVLRLQIDGDVKGARLELFGDTTYPGADHNGRLFEFFIVGREISKDRLSLLVTLPMAASERNGGTAGREIAFDCIPSTAITRHIGGGRTLQWRFDAERQELTGVDGGAVPAGPCRIDVGDGPSFASADGVSLIGSAHAQGRNIDALLADLESDSAAVRREARSALSAMGVAAVRSMMDFWERNPGSYRVRLGVSVALSEILRDKSSDKRAVSAALTDAQIRLLTQAAIDRDRTLRIYAAEFLYDLGDKRVVPAAESLFQRADDDGRFNLVLIVEGAVQSLSGSEKQALAQVLNQWRGMVGPKTQKLIDQVSGQLA